jgi:hypothetical protein
MSLHDDVKLAGFAIVALLSLHGYALGDDTASIQDALNAATGKCGTVSLACTQSNVYQVSSTIHVPACVKFQGACGTVPDEGSTTTIGTTLRWAGSGRGPVVSFHDAPGASLTGISIDCNPLPAKLENTIGIQYDSDDQPPSSFVNIDSLMIKGCHQGVVIGKRDNSPSNCQSLQAGKPAPEGCAEADTFKLERFRILGNSSDQVGEGIHINSANGAQDSLILNGNIQLVNIGIHVISTNGGLIIQSTNIGSEVGAVNGSAAFIQIESSVAASPTLINDEVESPPSVPVANVAAVVDHGCNPGGTPGNPVWLNNVWNVHPIIVDGNENVTSIGSLLNNATLGSSSKCIASNAANANAQLPHVLSINEVGWGPPTSSNVAAITNGAVFGASLIDRDVIKAQGPMCPPGFPAGAFPGESPGDLIACEQPHAGRLYLGQDLMLLNDGDGTLDTARMKIQTGLHPDGSGLKHQSVSTGNIAAGSTTKLPLTWTTEFADANYQAVCTVEDNTGSLQLVNTSVPTASSVIAAVKNNDPLNAHAGLVACVAVHN